jgi:hypothetical protein
MSLKISDLWRTKEQASEIARDTIQEEIHKRVRNDAPAIVAYPITNGFIVQMRTNSGTTGFTYCADHKAIADYIISNSVRSKLGVPEQMQFDFGAPGVVTLTSNTFTT